jgi:hypothetical protein
MAQPLHSWLKRVLDSVTRLLKIKSKREKSFLIHSNQLDASFAPRARRGGFQINATTRPQICPVCRTHGGQIERLPGDRFRCRTCCNEWS